MKYKILLSNPCQQEWSKMKASDKGKFCEKCQKKVHDLTKYSETQLHNTLKKNEKVCGKLRLSQINKEYKTSTKSFFPYFKALTGLTAFLSIFSSVTAQVDKKEKKGFNTSTIEEKEKKNFIKISGQVVNINNSPLPGVTIVTEKEKKSLGVISDLNGFFSIEVPVKENNKEVILSFQYIGFKYNELIFTKNASNIKVEMEEEVILLGDVVCRKQNIFNRIFRK